MIDVPLQMLSSDTLTLCIYMGFEFFIAFIEQLQFASTSTLSSQSAVSSPAVA
jgi:hypothetical protein